jgi:hypothetical protein
VCTEGDLSESSQLLIPDVLCIATQPKVALVRIPTRCCCVTSSTLTPTVSEEVGVGVGVEGLSIIIVTSPAPLHPDTSMLWSVLHSVDQNIPGLHKCPVIIVCDGYKLVGTAKRKNPYSLSKSGFIQEEAARTYEAYKSVLQHELDLLRPASHRQHVVLEMKDHAGFALSVKHALLHAKSTYQSTHSLVLQHDRVFTTKLSAAFIPRCLRTFCLQEHVRYVGFTTTASLNYMAVQRQQFRSVWDRMQEDLAVNVAAQDSEGPAVLVPMMFWYDSNHLVQIDRMLQMYTPFKTVPES